MRDCFFVGTIFELVDKTSGKSEQRKFMLIECFEKGKIFQLTCIEGSKPGRIYGYINEDPIAIINRAKAVSWKTLIENLDSIFIYEKSSLIISKDHSESIEKL